MISQLIALINSEGLYHVASLAAVATLTGVGVIPADVGIPLVTGLAGLGVGRTISKSSPAP